MQYNGNQQSVFQEQRQQTPQFNQQPVRIPPPTATGGYNGNGNSNNSRVSQSGFVPIGAGCSCCLLLMYILVSSLSQTVESEAAQMNPDLHFNPIYTKGCLIYNITITSETEVHQDNHDSRSSSTSNSRTSRSNSRTSSGGVSYSCVDTMHYSVIKKENQKYLYLPTTNTTTNTITTTNQRNSSTKIYFIDPKIDVQTVSDMKCEDRTSTSKKITPVYKNQSLVDCWDASSSMPEKRPAYYNCYNTICLKIFSPFTATANAEELGNALASLSSFLITAAVVACLATIGCIVKQKNNKSSITPTHHEVPGSILMVPQQQQQNGLMMAPPPQQKQQYVQQPIMQQPMIPSIQPMIVQPVQPVQPQQFQQPIQMPMQMQQPIQPMVVQPQQQNQRIMMIACPPGAASGATILVNSPEGVQMQVTVPPGIGVGMQFKVGY